MDELTEYKNNSDLLHGYKIVDGKIAEHGQFVPAQFPTPLLAFQVLSFVTGAYFQNIISQQLNIINGKLDFLIGTKFEEDFANLKAKHKWLINENQLTQFPERDAVKAENNLEELDKIRIMYRNLLNKIEIKCQYTIGPNNIEAKKKWCEVFKNSYFIEIMNIIYIAEIEYLLTYALLYKMYSKMHINENVASEYKTATS